MNEDSKTFENNQCIRIWEKNASSKESKLNNFPIANESVSKNALVLMDLKSKTYHVSENQNSKNNIQKSYKSEKNPIS